MLPPFFFKGVSDDGVFAYYAEVIERVGSGCAPIYLYHIPQFTQVPITLGLIERLLKRYPTVIAGAKDSSGDWSNSKAMIDNFAAGGFDVFPASESFLSAADADRRRRLHQRDGEHEPGRHPSRCTKAGTAPEGAELQAKADAVRTDLPGRLHDPGDEARGRRGYAGEPHWRTVRPPLVALDQAIGDTRRRRARGRRLRHAGLSAALTTSYLGDAGYGHEANLAPMRFSTFRGPPVLICVVALPFSAHGCCTGSGRRWRRRSPPEPVTLRRAVSAPAARRTSSARALADSLLQEPRPAGDRREQARRRHDARRAITSPGSKHAATRMLARRGASRDRAERRPEAARTTPERPGGRSPRGGMVADRARGRRRRPRPARTVAGWSRWPGRRRGTLLPSAPRATARRST